MQTLTDLGQFSRREVNALLLGVRALLLAVSALANRLELFFHQLDGVSEVGQLRGDAPDVLVVRHFGWIVRRGERLLKRRRPVPVASLIAKSVMVADREEALTTLTPQTA